MLPPVHTTNMLPAPPGGTGARQRCTSTHLAALALGAKQVLHHILGSLVQQLAPLHLTQPLDIDSTAKEEVSSSMMAGATAHLQAA